MFAKARSWKVQVAEFSLFRYIFREIGIVLFSSLLIALFAKVAIPLPFTPVPIATQMNVVLCLSMWLGSRRAAASVFAFLLEGAVGLPVFAGGIGGLAVFLGPRGGYLIGYLLAAAVTGYLAERMTQRSPLKAFLAMLAGNGLVYLIGASYLATFVGPVKAVLLGVAPFVFGDLVKLAISVKLLSAWRWMKK